MHGGVAERRSYQHSRLACFTRITEPASARPVVPGTCADMRSAPNDPVRGVRLPFVPGSSSPGGGGSCCLFRSR